MLPATYYLVVGIAILLDIEYGILLDIPGSMLTHILQYMTS